MKSDAAATVRSRVTEQEPGLTAGKAYKLIRIGFYQGPYFEIINDRGEHIAIYEPKKHLHVEDLNEKSRKRK